MYLMRSPTLLRLPCAAAGWAALQGLLAATSPLSALVLAGIPVGVMSPGFDVNADGTVDFTLTSRHLQTTDVPSSSWGTSFAIQGVNGGRVLASWTELTTQFPRVLGRSEGATVPRAEDLPADQGYRYRADGLGGFGGGIDIPMSWWLGSTDLTELFLPIALSTADGDLYGYLHFSIIPSWPIILRNEAGEVAGTWDTPALLLLGWKLADSPGETLTVVPVPEPATLALMALGALTAAFVNSRRS